MSQRRYAAPRGRIPDHHDEPPARREMLYVLGAVIVIAFGAFVWNFYGGRDAPRIAPPSTAYKIAPPQNAAPDPAETSALNEVIEGEAPVTDGPIRARPAPEAPLDPAGAAPAAPLAARPEIGGAPTFVSSGPYVAQVAALQSEDAVNAIWQRLSTRAPALFAQAQLDVERADLGQRGIYYRVRVGYFADRENVGRFCDRIKQMGQDCIAVRR